MMNNKSILTVGNKITFPINLKTKGDKMKNPIFQEGDQVVCTMDKRYKGKVKEVYDWSSGSGFIVPIYDVYLDKPIRGKDGNSLIAFMFFGWQLESV